MGHLRRAWNALRADGSGPATARLFHRLLAATFLCAWVSLGVQVHVLIGSQGLLPIADYLERARETLSFLDFPTHMWLEAGDHSIIGGIAIGVLLAILALLGKFPRVCLALSSALYLGYATAGRTFLGFQWDNLLIECGILAALLPADRPARLAHVLFRLLLFKMYFESGMAKWQSQVGDWIDGSAMTLYYETAPLPTPLAYFAHTMPNWWHRLESWGVLAFELVVPWFVFGTRRLRLFALASMTAFQVAIFATGNYGFHCLLAIFLGAFLLEDRDVEQMSAWVQRKLRRTPVAPPPLSVATPAWRIGATAVATAWVWISFTDGMAHFDRDPTSYWKAAVRPLVAHYEPWRVANTYHMFGHVTRRRVEPEVQTFDGQNWVAHAFRYKPGDPDRAPPWVAPHQPRVDFRLWFHGLGHRGRLPSYVETLLERVCSAPEAVEGLFAEALPRAPTAARIAYWDYRFVTPEERRRTGAWWKREWVKASEEVTCRGGDVVSAP